MFLKRFLLVAVAFVLGACPAAFAQFGGGPGDVVVYAVTYNGSGAFQANPSATSTAANLANFKVVNLDSVPISSGAPFPLQRQVFYTAANETFQIGTDVETTIGLHRLFVYPTRIFQFEGILNAFGSLVGGPPAMLRFPVGLDGQDDVSLETLKVITWFPGPWPFIVLTDQTGPYPCPPGTSGLVCLFATPGLVTLPSLMVWTSLATVYPGAGWPNGIEMKLMDQDPSVGDTIEVIRIHPGKSTPQFRIPGHTHLFVLQGRLTIQPAGSGATAMNKYDYAFLPENFAVTLANPAQYSGPGAQ